MSSWVLDASALLAMLNSEPGSERGTVALADSVMSSVNLSEVVAKLVDQLGRGEILRSIGQFRRGRDCL